MSIHFEHWKPQRSYSEGSSLVAPTPKIQKAMFYIKVVTFDEDGRSEAVLLKG